MKTLFAVLLVCNLIATAQADTMQISKEMAVALTRESMHIVPLQDGVSMDDAVDSMKLRANALNFKLVAELPLSRQVEVMGQSSRRMEIFAFCNALIAKELVEFDIVFAGFLPCRIALVEDSDGKGWLVTSNMDMVLHATDLPPRLADLARKVRDAIVSIVEAGAAGEL